MTQLQLSRDTSEIVYGSADLKGKVWEDYTCLKMLHGTGNKTKEQRLDDADCFKFELLALSEA